MNKVILKALDSITILILWSFSVLVYFKPSGENAQAPLGVTAKLLLKPILT